MDTNSQYEKKFPLYSTGGMPKKQAKSYEIDLGQNNGPYKQDLLIRYGDHTIHQIMNKMQAGTNMNMEDIMKMNDALKPFQERPKDVSEDNLTDWCRKIENNISTIEDDSTHLKEFEDNLTKAIELMTNDIFKYFEDSYNEFNPEFLIKYKYYKQKVKDQKDENANLQKQIDLLMQENTQIMDLIEKTGTRIANLEMKSGVENVQNDDSDDDDLMRENDSEN